MFTETVAKPQMLLSYKYLSISIMLKWKRKKKKGEEQEICVNSFSDILIQNKLSYFECKPHKELMLGSALTIYICVPRRHGCNL